MQLKAFSFNLREPALELWAAEDCKEVQVMSSLQFSFLGCFPANAQKQIPSSGDN
jgi:hypothetical protein